MWLYFVVALCSSVYLVDSLNSTDPLNQSNLLDFFSDLTNLPKVTDFLSEYRSMKNVTDCKLCYMNTVEMCEYYGFNFKTYTLKTSDGYILTVFRCYKNITKRQPVLLVHGMMDSSDTWILSGNKSLAFNYVQLGYDVFLINCRGNRYSRKHQTHSPDNSSFWNFTWYEMAMYDVPETIIMILDETNSKTLQCVGHSQGGTILLALLAEIPRYNQIITHVGLLAPFTYMQKVGFPINTVIEYFFYHDLNNFEFLPHTNHQYFLAQFICRIGNGAICNIGLNFILGPSHNQIDPHTFVLIFCHFPAGCSSKQMVHFGQEYHCKYFGRLMQSSSPHCNTTLLWFDLSRITTAVTLFYSLTDPHTAYVDIETLIANLKNANDLAYHQITEFNHIDFIWGKNAVASVYNALISRAASFIPRMQY